VGETNSTLSSASEGLHSFKPSGLSSFKPYPGVHCPVERMGLGDIV
jgi:hypothetical protein